MMTLEETGGGIALEKVWLKIEVVGFLTSFEWVYGDLKLSLSGR